MLRLVLGLLVAACLVPHSGMAESTSALPTPTVKVDGYVEAFYQLNFNQPSNLITAYRGFDNRSNSFTIDNAVLDVTGQMGPVSARLALQVGHAAASYYLPESSHAAEAGVGASGPLLWQLIQQAIIGYQIPVGRGLLGEAGIFLSPVGVEYLAIKDNWNWSRSTLFFALPAYHAGVRFTYPFTERWSGILYVVNGWNDIVNRNPYPCVSGVATYTVPDRLSVTLLYFGGVEQPTGAPERQPWRHLFDANAIWTVRPWLALAAQVDSGFERNTFGVTSWAAGAAYARVQPIHWLYLAARADFLHESPASNERGTASRLFFPASNVNSQTLTADFRPADYLSLRVELRRDGASAPMYFQGTVLNVGGLDIPTARAQETVTLGATAWF